MGDAKVIVAASNAPMLACMHMSHMVAKSSVQARKMTGADDLDERISRGHMQVLGQSWRVGQ